MFNLLARPLRGSAWSRYKNHGFLQFLKFPRDPLRGSALQPSAEGRQKFEVFATFVVRTVFGNVSWLAGTGPLVRGRASQDAICILKQLAQSNLRRASCTEQLAQTNMHRLVCGAPCLEQLAQSNLRRSNLHRVACIEQFVGSAILHRATCREPLAGTWSNLCEQLAQYNLRRATCADQLAPTSLRRAPCLVLSCACFAHASCREKERILQR